jgi:hypothetical protein
MFINKINIIALQAAKIFAPDCWQSNKTYLFIHESVITKKFGNNTAYNFQTVIADKMITDKLRANFKFECGLLACWNQNHKKTTTISGC